MPIVLDCAPGGAILGGHFFISVPEGAVESGNWRVVIPQAIYARAAHILGPPAPTPHPQPAGRDVQMGGMAPTAPVRAVAERDVLLSQREEEPMALDAGQEDPTAAQPPPSSGKRPASPSPPTAPSQAKKPRSSGPSLIVRLPIAVDIDENTGVATVANIADPHKQDTLQASQIPHIGIIFPTRRAILLRHDDPYICNLCGKGFPHPADMKAHFEGHPGVPERRGCWVESGSKAGVTWDEHESCKVREGDLHFARCKGGWVVLDQESWDKISRATEAGKRFLEGKGRDKMKVRERAAGEDWTTVSEEEVSEAMERQQPERKVVRAGDEAETNTGFGTSKEKRAAPKKASLRKKSKQVKAADETDKDSGAPPDNKAETAHPGALQASMSESNATQAPDETEAKLGAPAARGNSPLQPNTKMNTVRAGHLTETDAAAAKDAASTTNSKAPPKRKVVRAGDETETDVSGARRR